MNPNLLTFLVQETGLSTTYERERIESLIRNVAKYCIGEYKQATNNDDAEVSLRQQFNLPPRKL
jgi:hypothetical protein